ncbi:MAG TPA: SynChlorMet cassette radical SAM/SPASM protein ScmE [Methanoregulaceae archaeon]|nr:SynChlorMet cassette radical SAM/SPASM protein ScmE [Methanoregulaceae archaeon]
MPRVMRTPRTIEIDITNRCNLRCEYCYHFSSEGDVASDLPTDEWLAFFDELGRSSVMEVTLGGGEPFVREDITELIDGIVRNRMRYSVLSNGTLITEDQAAFLAGTRRCNHIQVSIDGSAPEVHESCRGAGTFRRAVHAIEVLQAHGVPVAVRVTVHHRNVRDLPNIARFLLDDLGLPSFSTNAASYLGLCRDHSAGIALTVEDRVLAMTTLESLNERYGGRIQAAAGPLAEVRMWREMVRKTAEGSAMGDCAGGCLSSCGGVFSKLAVRADGVYIPCTLLPGTVLGRITVDDLADLWSNHPELERLRTRQTLPLAGFEECGGCDYIPYCRGGCPGLSYTLTGSPYRPSPDACLRRFLRESGLGPGSFLAGNGVTP